MERRKSKMEWRPKMKNKITAAEASSPMPPPPRNELSGHGTANIPKEWRPKIKNKITAAEASSPLAPPPRIEPSGHGTANIPKKEWRPKIKNKITVAPPPWIELPGDVTANILKRVDADEILRSAQLVCTTWWKVCQDPAMWRVIDLSKRSLEMFMEEGYSEMCRRAVDLSQGQLVDLSIDYFADDQLINYVAYRSSNLKRLALRSCYRVSGKGLARAVKKLPELEELHLIIMKNVSPKYVKEIGISCPKLKSFSYNVDGHNPYIAESPKYNYAIAIGESMPNLQHLGLYAHVMENDVLQVILDGCPNLESLDIRQCFGLDLGGDLGKRCREQIKVLKLPSDSVSDLEWSYDCFGDDDDDDSDYDYDYDYDYDGYCEEYDDNGRYDDYFSPNGYGLFGDDGSDFLEHVFFELALG